jgi:hypothetical protein
MASPGVQKKEASLYCLLSLTLYQYGNDNVAGRNIKAGEN